MRRASWEAGVNRVIAAAARRYPNVVMANWFATIEHRTSLLWPDEVHPAAQRGPALRADGRLGGPGRPGGGRAPAHPPPPGCRPARTGSHPRLTARPQPRAARALPLPAPG